MTPNRDWITIREAVTVAADLKMPASENTIYTWAQGGEIVAEKAGPKALLIHKPTFIAFLKARAADPLAKKLHDRLKDAQDDGTILCDDEKLVPDLLRYLRAKMG